MTTPDAHARAGEVAERIRRYRSERGWTQAQLAAKAGLSRATVSRIESGAERPLGRTAQALAEALGVELERLLGLAGQPALFPLPDELRMDLVRRVTGLSDGEVERVHAAACRLLEDARSPKPRTPARQRREKAEP